MSTLLARALEGANLDLLLLGALADKMRAAERGDVVRLHLDVPSDEVPTFDRADDAHSFLRKIAIARLSGRGPIRVDARTIGMQLAQVALTFGADDIDSVSAIDDDSQGHRRSPLEEIRRSIEAASLRPVERDARFNPI